jgi:hypothetical protein
MATMYTINGGQEGIMHEENAKKGQELKGALEKW